MGMKEGGIMETIQNYDDYVKELLQAGFTMGGENGEGIFTLCDFFGREIGWHTEDADTDPWEWRMRVLYERKDIAYGKLFFKKSGYITKEWYPYFFAVRRSGRELFEEYEAGQISRYAKKIYELLLEHKELPLHLLKEYGGFGKEDKSRFDSALTQLQMKLYISMCGRDRKRSQKGVEYGWNSTVFCLTEDFFEEDILTEAKKIPYKTAYEALWQQVYRLNPKAPEKKVKKFILGA